jgi:hypothetical protein
LYIFCIFNLSSETSSVYSVWGEFFKAKLAPTEKLAPRRDIGAGAYEIFAPMGKVGAYPSFKKLSSGS